MKNFARQFFQAAVAAAAIFHLSTATVYAVVDDAHAFAMEAAAPDAESGFEVRDDYWSGEMKSGGKELIRHQLFRGNEYAFWLGVDADSDCVLDIKIYDAQGKRIPVEAKSTGYYSVIHIAPPKTGSYFIVVSAKSAKGGKVPWALAYGYR